MRISEASKSEGGNVGSMRDGKLAQKFLLTGEDDSPNNYLLNVGRTGSGGWGTPRHRHTFGQIRYVLKGSYPVSPHKVMEEGSVAYFPESVHYGPQDRPEGLEMMVIQFGDASGKGFLSVARREKANEELKQIGTFHDGIFTWEEDGRKFNVDGSEACIAHALGMPLKKSLTFAKPRYDDVVLMDPKNFDWIPTGMDGVSEKLLGIFTERQLKIKQIKVEAGATFNTGTRDQIEVLFLSHGSITVDGETYDERTGIELLPGDAPTDIVAKEEALFLSISLPKF